ncbi:MAG: ABC transporter ATP-binding protein [Lachnospiraceae bacterium]|nr:ABC transporter ATP-binding protein [Lachnospiraceae bacterium]
MSKLVAKGIVKTYGNKDVLHGVDLELESGKIYGLIGRNGAGKTTLLSILTSQNPASAGTVTLDGQPVWENPAVLEHLCFSRELNQLSGGNANTMKVKEYLNIAATYFPYWDQKTAERLIQKFGLDVKKRIDKLSKGMLSMVTIIVALASKAEFTFLDEPVAGLDVVAREMFYELLVEEFTETGRTFVISTHIIEEAADVLEEVIIVDKGKILLKENTQELLERSYHISGHEDEVNRATAFLEVHHEEHLGRSKGVTVLLAPGQSLPDQYDVSIQKLSLQKVFVALCGEES